jgi:hypothetical protein
LPPGRSNSPSRRRHQVLFLYVTDDGVGPIVLAVLNNHLKLWKRRRRLFSQNRRGKGTLLPLSSSDLMEGF